MAVTVNDTIIQNIINFTLQISSLGLEFGKSILTELVNNWAATFAAIIIIGALIFKLKDLPAVKKYLPNLS